MEKLTRTELMLIKCSILAEKHSLEKANELLESKSMSSTDITNYVYNKNLIDQYNTILMKLQ